MPQSHAALYCHFVFSTKDREPYIEPAIRDDLYAVMGGIVRERQSVLVSAGGIADHVHLLVSLSREWAVCDLVRDIKANSSHWVHEKYPEKAFFAWQAGYGVFSVSVSQLPTVKNYIARQEEHHRTLTFQDEYRKFLKKHGIEYDERYVWD
jgi:REP element-mobilizing transposase RayT